jgi:hypothetical protein
MVLDPNARYMLVIKQEQTPENDLFVPGLGYARS